MVVKMDKNIKSEDLAAMKIDRDQFKFWFDITRDLFLAERIDEETYRGITSLMIVGDQQGNVWAPGAKTGKWYRKEGDKWVEGIPNETLIMMVPKEKTIRANSKLGQLIKKGKKRHEELDPKDRWEPQGFRDGGIAAAEKRWEEYRKLKGTPVTEAAPVQVKETRKCQKCGSDVPVESKFCNNCGLPVEVDKKPGLECGMCGNENPEGSKFCMNCGEQLILPEPEPDVCPECDFALPPGSKFCPNCGSQI